jgi:hypothetical protein
MQDESLWLQTMLGYLFISPYLSVMNQEGGPRPEIPYFGDTTGQVKLRY